jgi:hypothetical protein
VAGDVGELAGGCALGVEVKDSASFQYVFPYSEADSGLLFVAQQGKVDVEEVEGSELVQRPSPSQRRPGWGCLSICREVSLPPKSLVRFGFRRRS